MATKYITSKYNYTISFTEDRFELFLKNQSLAGFYKMDLWASLLTNIIPFRYGVVDKDRKAAQLFSGKPLSTIDYGFGNEEYTFNKIIDLFNKLHPENAIDGIVVLLQAVKTKAYSSLPYKSFIELLRILIDKDITSYISFVNVYDHTTEVVRTKQEYVEALVCNIKTRLIGTLGVDRFLNAEPEGIPSLIRQLADDNDFWYSFGGKRFMYKPEYGFNTKLCNIITINRSIKKIIEEYDNPTNETNTDTDSVRVHWLDELSKIEKEIKGDIE